MAQGMVSQSLIMALVQQLLFWTAHRQLILDITCIATTQNGAADALSRNNLERFRRLRPQAAAQPARLPDLTSYLSDAVRNAHVLTGFRL